MSEQAERTTNVGAAGDQPSGRDAAAVLPGRQFVINWHLTEACNYACTYCYARWARPAGRELVHDREATRRLLRQLFAFFGAGAAGSAPGFQAAWDSVRLNVAGGEPLLYRESTLAAIRDAHDLGFEVSMITNGSLLDSELTTALAPRLSMLGISVDSAVAATNFGIGRADRRNRLAQGIEDVAATLRLACATNPQLRLKVNTVVNALNWREDMVSAIGRLGPHKWKVLQMLPVHDGSLAVSAEEFRAFVARHESLRAIMSVEDNDSMTESYIMVDPHGRFYQNAPGSAGAYRYSRPIPENGAAAAFAEMRWSEGKFLSRYAVAGRPGPGDSGAKAARGARPPALLGP